MSRTCRESVATAALVLVTILLASPGASAKPPPSAPNVIPDTVGARDASGASGGLLYSGQGLQPPAGGDYMAPYSGVSFGPMGPVTDPPASGAKAGVSVSTITGAAPRVDDSASNRVKSDSGGGGGVGGHDDGGGGEGGGHGGGVQVFSVSFSRVETPFIIGLWIFCASLAKIGFHMTPKLSKIFPESCLLVVVGLVIGAILFNVTESIHMSPLTPDTFFFYMLPPIILDAGYFMPNRLFFDHLGTILLFAVIGTIFNTLTIGASLWAVGTTGLFGIDTPILDMFLFSSLISAVDPVAVLAVFEEIQVNEILYIVVFGESLLNDAVTVVLYHMFEGYSEMGLSNIVYTDVLKGFASFFVVAIGGTVIGVIWGFATGFVTRFTNEVRVIEPIFIFVMAYLAYLNAEIFHMSGILAITFCGITMKNYVEANISHKSHTTIKYAMKMLSSSSETIIFMFLGVSTINSNHDWNTWFVLLTILFCSVFRIIGVIFLTAIANKFRIHQLSKVEKFVMSYGGLRGAVAFALVLLINPNVVKLQPMFVTTTIAVIYFTVFIQGISIKPLVRVLKVKTADKRKPTMNERIHERLMDHAMAAIEDILGQHGNYHVRDRFKRFDNKFIRPHLLRDHYGAEPKILETYSKLARRDALDYMRRNASTIGNISGTESMSAIFRNYTAANLNGSTSFSHLDMSTWNIDMQELEYNPSKKDLTDAKIHHLLAEELVKPYKRHRRLSYSRHAVNDRDLSTQVNYKVPFTIRRLVADKKHKRHSKKMSKFVRKLNILCAIPNLTAESNSAPLKTSKTIPISIQFSDGKHQNHVSFPELQNGSAKQFSHDYISEVLNEEDTDPKTNKEDWDSPITFTAKSSPSEEGALSTATEEEGTSGQLTPLMGLKLKNRAMPSSFCVSSGAPSSSTTTAVEGCLPWRRDRSPQEGGEEGIFNNTDKRLSKGSIEGVEMNRVATPTATEAVLPWKREDSEASTALQQSEFPAWCSNKEYLAYNSPSATFLGGIETARSSVIGLFRRESNASAQFSGSESSSPMKERRGSNAAVIAAANAAAAAANGTGSSAVDVTTGDPLGAAGNRRSTEGAAQAVSALPGPPQSAPQTPGQWRRRRGSQLLDKEQQLSGSTTNITSNPCIIPEQPSSSSSTSSASSCALAASNNVNNGSVIPSVAQAQATAAATTALLMRSRPGAGNAAVAATILSGGNTPARRPTSWFSSPTARHNSAPLAARATSLGAALMARAATLEAATLQRRRSDSESEDSMDEEEANQDARRLMKPAP